MIATLIVGGICGYLASVLMKGKGAGILMNIIIGVIGSGVGSLLFTMANISYEGLFGDIVQGVVGAAVLIVLARIISK